MKVKKHPAAVAWERWLNSTDSTAARRPTMTVEQLKLLEDGLKEKEPPMDDYTKAVVAALRAAVEFLKRQTEPTADGVLVTGGGVVYVEKDDRPRFFEHRVRDGYLLTCDGDDEIWPVASVYSTAAAATAAREGAKK